MENKKLKAYIVTDNYFLEEYVVVFAESNSKARSVAYQWSDSFWDNKYIDLRANRSPYLDEFAEEEREAYCLPDFWVNQGIRRVLMTHYSFHCIELNPKNCMYCDCRDICEMWEEYLEEHKLEEEINFS